MFNRPHGHVGTREYNAWFGMKDRCRNRNNKIYKFYGGRGIAYAAELEVFTDFLAIMGTCPEGMSLDRIDNNGNYEPGNMRWASKKTQARNRRNNRLITFDGKTLTLAEWSEITGLQAMTIKDRISRYGWTVEKALTRPAMTPLECGKLGGKARHANG